MNLFLDLLEAHPSILEDEPHLIAWMRGNQQACNKPAIERVERVQSAIAGSDSALSAYPSKPVWRRRVEVFRDDRWQLRTPGRP